MSKYIQTAKEQYVTIKSYAHYGEHFVIVDKECDKIIGISLDCKHNTQRLLISREDI